MKEWQGGLTKSQAIKLLERITNNCDPYWDEVVNDNYDEANDTMPSVYHLYIALGITEQEYKDATGADNPNWPKSLHSIDDSVDFVCGLAEGLEENKRKLDAGEEQESAVSDSNHRQNYVELVCDVLNKLAKYSGLKISGSVIFSNKLGLSIVELVKANTHFSYTEKQADTELNMLLESIMKHLPQEHSHIVYMRNIKVFDKDKLYIVKPNIKRYWSKTMALSDAQEITVSILRAKLELR